MRIESLQKRNSDLTQNLSACDQLLAELQRQNLEEENRDLTEENRGLTESNRDLVEQVAALNSKVESLQTALTSNDLCSSDPTGESGQTAIVKAKGEIFQNSSQILRSSAFMIPSKLNLFEQKKLKKVEKNWYLQTSIVV